MTATPPPDEPQQTPSPGDLQVVKGEPTAEELAALVIVVNAKAAQAREAARAVETSRRTPAGVSPWGAYWRRVREPLHPRPGGWRASARPG